MLKYDFKQTNIPGLTLITPLFIPDQRGYLAKPFESCVFAVHNIHFHVAEELESKSEQHTLRGLHFQHQHSQDKLVRVLSGEIYDVAVDLRPESSAFGKWQGFALSAENRQMLYIPKHFAHGFLVLGREAIVHYLCGDRYVSESEDGIIWNDPDLAINWPLGQGITPLLSPRDQSFQSFNQFCRSNNLEGPMT
ncbi:MAG: dTDP-4-dehydrorhamnose 3,5-epimerase [Acutalibacter sp.]|nr:dTDP-4-dehydrorhamnose 3,5-epimerase [Acutalibacter sp.]